MREKEIESYLRDRIRRIGGKAYKFVSPGNNGVPDRLVCLPGGHAVFVELKAPGKAPRPIQIHQIGMLKQLGFRVEVDHRNEKIGKKIREATLEKVPYMLVVGDRDMENGTVSVRHRSGEDLGAMSLDAFAALLSDEVSSMAIK